MHGRDVETRRLMDGSDRSLVVAATLSENGVLGRYECRGVLGAE